MKKSELNELLKTPLFSACNQNTLCQVLEEGSVNTVEYAENTPITEPTDAEKNIGIVLSGKASVWTVTEPITLLRFLEKGAIFGVANLFTKQDYISLIKAESKTKVLFISKETIEKLISADSAFLASLLAFYGERIAFLNQKINYLTGGSAEHKLALVLMNSGKDEILLQNSIGSLSELLNLGRASLYRAFDKLIALGLIQKNGRTILISNRQKLKDFCRNSK